MKTHKTIALLFHETTSAEKARSYRMWHVAKVWEQQGHKIQIIHGAKSAINADLLIPQLDMSTMPPAYKQLIQSSSNVINSRVFDIRKSTFSQNRVAFNDEYDGPVIIKTDQNAGGAPERLMLRDLSPIQQLPARVRKLSCAIRKVIAARSFNRLAYTTRISSNEYPVFASKHDVPAAVFDNNALIVERFLPERDGDFYCSRVYNFLGNKDFTVRSKAHTPVVKESRRVVREIIPVDEEIVKLRHELGFDQGKFDYVMRNGKAILLDINDTPMAPPIGYSEVQMENIKHLASGIEAWL